MLCFSAISIEFVILPYAECMCIGSVAPVLPVQELLQLILLGRKLDFHDFGAFVQGFYILPKF